MAEESWGLSPDLLNQVFPFHLVVGRDGSIHQVGASLLRLCPDLAPGRAWQELVKVVSPRGDGRWDWLRTRERSLVVLEVTDCDLTLRGQMLHEADTDVVIFVGSPWITDLAAIGDRGLTLDDFSVADPVVDYLLLLQTQGTALAQSRAMAEELQQTASQLNDRAHRLERLSRELEQVLNSAGEGIYGLDAGGAVTFANQAAGRLIRMSPAEMIGRSGHELLRMEATDGTRVAVTAEGLSARQVTGRHRRVDGSSFDAELVCAPIIDEGSTVGTVVVLRDVSERHAVDRMKGEFISVISHELRTPLTSIGGALGLLDAGAAGVLEPRAARMVQLAKISTDRLMRLINDMLDVEGMVTGMLTMNLQRTDAADLINAAVTEMTGLATSSRVRLELRAAEGVVMADADRIVQTLNNLLGNAVKFSVPGATVEVAATIDGSHVRFDVIDSGPGIPADLLEAVFEPFRQVDASDTRSRGGSGLGLAICRGLVERHGGQIWATSADGGGTIMSFTLPTPHDWRAR